MIVTARLLIHGMPLIRFGLCQARDNPVKPMIRKLGTIAPILETRPPCTGRLNRFESVRQNHSSINTGRGLPPPDRCCNRQGKSSFRPCSGSRLCFGGKRDGSGFLAWTTHRRGHTRISPNSPTNPNVVPGLFLYPVAKKPSPGFRLPLTFCTWPIPKSRLIQGKENACNHACKWLASCSP